MFSIFAHPWGLLALAGLPAILALHLFWRRFRPRRIAGLFLWAPEARQVLAGRTRDRLYRTASLVCELLAATALALAAAGLSPPAETRGRHLAVVLDGSASMSARGRDGVTFAEWAAGRARGEIEKLGPGDAVTVLVSGPAPRLVSGPRGSVESALTALDAYAGPPGAPGTPFAESDALDEAMSLAAELGSRGGRAAPGGEVLVLTDTPRNAGMLPPGATLVATGEPRGNVAIVAAARVADRADGRAGPAGRKSDGRVFVAVRNLGRSPAECEVVFRRAGREIARSPVKIEAGGTVPVALPLRGRVEEEGEADPVDVRLEAPEDVNALALDDAVTLLPARFPGLVFENRLAGPAKDMVDRALACVRGVRRAGEDEAPALVFCRSEEDAVPPGAWRVIFTGKERVGSRKRGPRRLAGPYVLARRHPVLEDVSLAGVIWAVTQADAPAASASPDATSAPLVSCGGSILAAEKRIARGPGGGAADRPGLDRAFVFHLDLARSNIARTPAWPVLIGNVVEERRRHLPGVERRNVELGGTVRVRLAPASADCSVASDVPGEGRHLPLHGSGAERAFPARTPGVFEVRTGRGVLDRFAVNLLSPRESDLGGLGGGTAEAPRRAVAAGEPGGSRSPFAARPAWPVAALAAVALLACVGDWFVLGRAGRLRTRRGKGEGT